MASPSSFNYGKYTLPMYKRSTNLSFNLAEHFPEDQKCLIDNIWNFHPEKKYAICDSLTRCFGRLNLIIDRQIPLESEKVNKEMEMKMKIQQEAIEWKDRLISSLRSKLAEKKGEIFSPSIASKEDIEVSTFRLTHRTAESLRYLPQDVKECIYDKVRENFLLKFQKLQRFLGAILSKEIEHHGISVTHDIWAEKTKEDEEDTVFELKVQILRAVIIEMFYEPIEFEGLTITSQTLLDFGMLAVTYISMPSQAQDYGRYLEFSIATALANFGQPVWVYFKSIPPYIEDDIIVTPAFHRVWIRHETLGLPDNISTFIPPRLCDFYEQMCCTEGFGCGYKEKGEPIVVADYFYQWCPPPLPLFAENSTMKIYMMKSENPSFAEVPPFAVPYHVRIGLEADVAACYKLQEVLRVEKENVEEADTVELEEGAD